MKSISQFSRLFFVVLSFAVLLLAGCGGSDSPPTTPFTADQVSGKTFAYSSAGSTGTLAFNADTTWSTTIGAATFSGTWSITDGKLVCVTTSGGNHTLTYTAFVGDDANVIGTSVVEVNPADPNNPITYTATLTALYTIAGKVSQFNAGWAGVTVALEGDQTLTATTDADGNYRFMVPAGEYRITPSKGNSAFAPLDNSFAVGGADVGAVDFASVAPMAGPHINTWIQTGSLIYPRELHTATLLKNGQVLVAGGDGNPVIRASAEIYDPDTGKWTQTGSLIYPREYDTATLLQNGKVLVAGGQDYPSISYITRASAEIYDPDTGKWTQTGSLAYDRYGHTATLLQDGRVLVAGGEDNLGQGATAEIYNPDTGKWTQTGSLNYKRSFHTAALLQDGRVLVAGGATRSDYRASAEIYDPATGRWTQTGSLNQSRAHFTATTLHDGRVLVAGGMFQLFDTRASAEIYDPDTGKWTQAGSLNAPRSDHTATLLQDGRVLVAGGFDSDHTSIHASAEIYDPVTGLWTQTGSLTYKRCEHTATLLDNGAVLITGGWGSSLRASTELFFPGP